MANDATKTPLILDSTGAVFAAGIITRALSVRWVGATTAGHKLILKNAAGRIVFEEEANAANYVAEGRPENVWNGLTVDTIGSGKVYIEV